MKKGGFLGALNISPSLLALPNIFWHQECIAGEDLRASFAAILDVQLRQPSRFGALVESSDGVHADSVRVQLNLMGQVAGNIQR